MFRRCIVYFLSDQEGPDAELGGEGVTVEIDESSFKKKKKYGKGKTRKDRWVFGIIERDKKKRGFGRKKLFAVPNRRRQTLLSIILKHVKAGTRIISDNWAAYHVLDKHKNYNHQVVNHARGFVEDGPGNEDVCLHFKCVLWLQKVVWFLYADSYTRY